MLTHVHILQFLTMIFTIYLGIYDLKTFTIDKPTTTEVRILPLRRSKTFISLTFPFLSVSFREDVPNMIVCPMPGYDYNFLAENGFSDFTGYITGILDRLNRKGKCRKFSEYS